jgi:hypothetical protein
VTGTSALTCTNTLIKDIQRGDDGGIGKPELLKTPTIN